jgi:hypothetical protein
VQTTPFGRALSLGVLAAGAAILLRPITPSLVPMKGAALRRHDPVRIHHKRDNQSWDSTNWSGYAVTAGKGDVTDVKGSWVVPTVQCSGPNSTPGAYSSFWVGIDGWNSNSVEQIGTDSDCASAIDGSATTTGVYYAWFEFYPQASYYIGNPDNGFAGYVVQPGDTITAEVKSGSAGGKGPGKKFAVILTSSRGWTFTATSSGNAQQSSAEWIAEAPCCGSGNTVLPLANFGISTYSNSTATIGSQTGGIGSFGANVQEVTMVTESAPSGQIKAQPSALINGTGFQVTWFRPGP